MGNVHVDTPLVLAPMEDVTALPMRAIAKKIGRPGLLFTEFISAMAIHYGGKSSAHKTFKKLRIDPGERPLAIQIFGGDPDIMAETARIVEDAGADILDINMGCWVPKVCKTGSGAALLKDPDTAEAIVRKVVSAVKIPVSVKVRAGWDYSLFAAPDLVRRFQDAGVKMITLHARFAKQGFEGEADWRLIESLRKVVSVPLIGNGDVKTPEDALKMLRETGCDGVMVGRAAISNPWALGKISAALRGELPPPEPTIQDRIDAALEHVQRMIAYEVGTDTYEQALETDLELFASHEQRAVRSLRGQLPMYIKGEPGVAQVRSQLYSANRLQDIEAAFEGLLKSLSELPVPAATG